MIKNKIIYILGTFKYPYGDAASMRLTMLSKALIHSGAEVKIVSCSGRRGGINNFPSGGYRDGVPYEILDSASYVTGFRLVDWAIRFISARFILVKFLKTKNAASPNLIISYNPGAWVGSGILKWGKQNSVPIIFDIVEWFDVNQCLGGYFGPVFYDSELFIRCISKKADGLIVISRYLEEYYKQFGIATILIPGLIDVMSNPKVESPLFLDEKFRVLYSGSPGKKDMLLPLMEAAKIIRNLNILNIQFIFTGFNILNALKIQNISPKLYENCSNVKILGWLSEVDMNSVRNMSDIMIVFRQDNRSSLANFPQKFSEYMGSKKAVIINNVGDMKDYIQTGKNGIILNELSGQVVADAIISISTEPDRAMTLGLNAFKTAKEFFDFRSISNKLSLYFFEILASSNKR